MAESCPQQVQEYAGKDLGTEDAAYEPNLSFGRQIANIQYGQPSKLHLGGTQHGGYQQVHSDISVGRSLDGERDRPKDDMQDRGRENAEFMEKLAEEAFGSDREET